MEWKKFTIKTLSDAEDIVTGVLADNEIYSIEIEDTVPLTDQEKAQMFVDIAPERNDDGIAYISFYLEEGEDYKSKLEAVNASLQEAAGYCDLGELSITTESTEDQDWINNWKQYFKQFYIDDILFIPSWEEVKNPGDASMIIHIDPGTAFGTGSHETTQLCIRELKEYVKEGYDVLDVGTGSGILAMMAFKFGAKSVYATDLDPCSVDACQDNFKKNSLGDENFTLVIGNIIDDAKVQKDAGFEKYDIVVANILADVLVPLTPAAVAAMKKGAYFITSGIIEGKEQLVAKAMEDAGLKVVSIKEQGEWRCVTGMKA